MVLFEYIYSVFVISVCIKFENVYNKVVVIYQQQW